MDNRTKETVKVFDDAATRYQEKYMDVSPYSDSLTLFCNSLSSSTCNILDVACGPGNVTKYIIDRMPNAKFLACDLSNNMIALAKINVPAAETILLDAKHIKTIDLKFEGVLASFIFPYLSKKEVFEFIRDTSEILTDGGLIYISTMKGRNSDSGYVGPSDGTQVYMNFHEENYIEEALFNFGFDLISSKLQPYDYGQDNKGIDIIIIGKLRA